VRTLGGRLGELGDPDTFVSLPGFPDMPGRACAPAAVRRRPRAGPCAGDRWARSLSGRSLNSLMLWKRESRGGSFVRIERAVDMTPTSDPLAWG
jgi:hypothetical protein